MSSVVLHTALSSARLRSLTITGLMAATMLTAPIATLRAESPILMAQATVPATVTPLPGAPPNRAAAGATEAAGETVEQRITNLRAALKITGDQDAAWQGVAKAMRENAAAMDKLIAATRTNPPQNTTAVEDLTSYQKFAQAHVDGLKNLIASFSTLYTAMPAAQKKIADDVFNAPPRMSTGSRG